MKNKLKVAISPITGTIYAGSVGKDGRTWLSNKTDVTGSACAAVAQSVLRDGGCVEILANGKPAYEISVKVVGED